MDERRIEELERSLTTGPIQAAGYWGGGDTSMSRSTWPVVVGGSHRSGTSLLRRMLNAHSRIYCGPEVSFIRDFYNDFARMPPGGRTHFLSTLRTLLPEEEVLAVVGRAYVMLLERAAAQAHKARWADKNPHNVVGLNAWQQLLGEDWLFVHVVRNPLDTLASMADLDWPEVFPPYLRGRIAFYLRYLQAGLDFSSAYPHRYRRVFYEQIVTHPEREITGLMAWLDETFEPDQLQFNDMTHQLGLEDPKIHQTKKIHHGSIGRWRNVFKEREVAQIINSCQSQWKEIDPDGEIDALIGADFTPLSVS